MLPAYNTISEIIVTFPLSLAINVTDVTLGEIDLWLGTWTGAGGTATLAYSSLMDNRWSHSQLTILKILESIPRVKNNSYIVSNVYEYNMLLNAVH